VAISKRIDNEKVVVLKPDYKSKLNYDSDSVQSVHSVELSSLGGSLDSLPKEDPSPAEELHEVDKENVEVDSGRGRSENGKETMKETEYMVACDQQVSMPVAPPRRKHSEKKSAPPAVPDSGQTKVVEGDKESEPKISVKEHAQKINKRVSETQLVVPTHQANGKRPGRDQAFDKNADDDDTASVISLNPTTKEWMVVAAKNTGSYIDMIKLLKDNPKLATFKDFTSGYTALHWAAKHGNIDIVKLIAGTHGADVNIRSHGGYTPLHLAAMHKRKSVYEILISTYKANRTLRDYNGKKAEDYWPRTQTGTQASNTVTQRPSRRNIRRNSDKEVAGFLRLGSFNVKVRKTTESHHSSSKSKATKLHKGWGSADNLPETMDKAMMPPPKTFSVHKSQKQRCKSLISTA